MDNPVFKLEGVVHERSAEALQDFEGPLDLILFLLSKNKIEIQDIPIALILDQYLAYLEQRKQLDLEVASEFITMAAHLMYIKTRMLLSLEDEQAQSEMDELIASLKERQQKDTYLRIKTLTETLGPMGEFGRSIMTRQPEPMQRGKIYEYSHEKADLVLAMQTIMERGEKLAAPPSAALSEIVRSIWTVRPRNRYCKSSAITTPLSAAASGSSAWRTAISSARRRTMPTSSARRLRSARPPSSLSPRWRC